MTPHHVAVLALDGVITLDLAIPVQIFESARSPEYTLTVCGLSADVRTSSGLRLGTPGSLRRLTAADTVIVPGRLQPRSTLAPTVLSALRRAHSRGARLVSICTGAFVLAAAGLLDGRPATTHWENLADLAADHPEVQVRDDVLYVDDGDVLTSAGMCCGIDLCLHIVRRDHGAAYANRVAREIVASPHRDGSQAQFVPVAVPTPATGSLAGTRDWALARLDRSLAVPDLARQAHLAPRSFHRRFVAETGVTPGRWLLDARIDRARELLETTDLTHAAIAGRCGLGTADNLRLHLRRRIGTTPGRYRAAFRGTGGGQASHPGLALND